MFNRILAAIALVCVFVLASAAPSLANQSPLAFHLGESAAAAPAGKIERQIRAGGRDVVAIAERYLGTNPTKMRRLWCANFLGMIEKKAGRSGSGSNFARSYASYGRKVSRSEARRGDIAVMARGKRGGHVGYFVGWAENGKAIVISGNSRGGRVSKGQYAASRIFAWRRPA